jgi:16S rRNA (guanine966-N2)-methyltransferase
MRIIAGEHRHRQILPPPDASTTRPITDRVKENLFNRLMALGLLGEGNVLDIFAGTGTLGIEALSRGADHCTFVERNRGIRTILDENLTNLGLTDRSTVLGVDALAADLPALLPRKPLTLIFCDPPYALTADEKTMVLIANLIARMAEPADAGAALVLRMQSHLIPPQVQYWNPPRTHPYGSMALHIYLRRAD